MAQLLPVMLAQPSPGGSAPCSCRERGVRAEPQEVVPSLGRQGQAKGNAVCTPAPQGCRDNLRLYRRRCSCATGSVEKSSILQGIYKDQCQRLDEQLKPLALLPSRNAHRDEANKKLLRSKESLLGSPHCSRWKNKRGARRADIQRPLTTLSCAFSCSSQQGEG